MCDLDAYLQTTGWPICVKAFGITGLYPLNPMVVLSCPDVRQGEDDPEAAMHVKRPRRALAGS
jgi:hypothetical protein